MWREPSRGDDASVSTRDESTRRVVDGNEAAAAVAYGTSEVIAIYPITPASGMGELSDAWSAAGVPNVWGDVPQVIELQSEAGAAGTLHGALQAGALATTFTASQGLLLMLPDMYKIAGELTPCVIHVAARSLATHALSIFGDHSDVMAARSTGFALLCAASVQEAQDMALVATAATLESRVPFLHFFDGFRTSHEVGVVEPLSEADIRALLPEELIAAHRDRALSPDRPVLRGSAQNPDVFFQAREAGNPYYAAVPLVVAEVLRRFEQRAGRAYDLVEYTGAPDADRVVVMMGSGCGAAEEAVEALCARGEQVGLLKVRLYRPFPAGDLLAALPATVRSLAVLDRSKDAAAPGEPLFMDVLATLAEAGRCGRGTGAAGDGIRVVGGRYGLASKELTPAMVAAAFAELALPEPRPRFTLGIHDDVTRLSLATDPDFITEAPDVVRAVFFGLGSDGTVSANKASVKIIAEETPLHAQGYFVYDSKKSGSTTVSHLRFGPRPIRSTYLVQPGQAQFVACHHFGLLERMDVLGVAAPGAVVLLNAPYGADELWDRLPREVQEQLLERQCRLYAVDASRVAREAGLGGRVNTVLQACFFALAGVLPREEAIAAIKHSVEKAYARRGRSVLERNYAAIDAAIGGMFELALPAAVTATSGMLPPVPAGAPDFVAHVTAAMIAGRGDELPVSALPVDGTFPVGTACFEKRSLADEIPVWDPAICIDCAKCALVCPHAAIRMKVVPPEALAGAPATFQTKEWRDRNLPGLRLALQVAPDDCTGCGICIDVCPARSKEVAKHKALDTAAKAPLLEAERANWDFFLSLPEIDRSLVDPATVKGSQLLQPLFEFSGACSGCGETPYLKLLTQLFGDRTLIANATGCSSIYGGNLPTTPWSANAAGRGPAWANSLFEDNAEFGLGMRLALDVQRDQARQLLAGLAAQLGDPLVQALLDADQSGEAGIAAQRARVVELKAALAPLVADGSSISAAVTFAVRRLLVVADALVKRAVWIVGGDGWAYDIGFGGLDHVLASGRDVNVLVLDTEVYSNTGGQASKATPLSAVAKFAEAGKSVPKKDLGMIASQYGHVYVAQVALGADNPQTVKAFAEAAAYPGPSLILAYSHCIAHGIDMAQGMRRQKAAVDTGYWPLYRHDPRRDHPFVLDSGAPKLPLSEFTSQEARFAMLARAHPVEAAALAERAQAAVIERRHLYEQLARIDQNAAGQAAAPEEPDA